MVLLCRDETRFALQEASLPFEAQNIVADGSEPDLTLFTDDQYPHMAAMVSEHYMQPGYRFSDEFDFGLNLILDALDATLSTD